MKRLIFSLLLLVSLSAIGQNVTRDKDGNFYAKGSAKTGAKPTLTKYFYTDSKGVKYPVYLTDKGKYFVIRKSAKTGKEYRQYLKVN